MSANMGRQYASNVFRENVDRGWRHTSWLAAHLDVEENLVGDLWVSGVGAEGHEGHEGERKEKSGSHC